MSNPPYVDAVVNEQHNERELSVMGLIQCSLQRSKLPSSRRHSLFSTRMATVFFDCSKVKWLA